MLGGDSRHFIGRLNPTGTLDETFHPDASSTIFEVTVQPDGRILVGGEFGRSERGDSFFHRTALIQMATWMLNLIPEADNLVRAFAIQPDGKILVGGHFTELAYQHPHVHRAPVPGWQAG